MQQPLDTKGPAAERERILSEYRRRERELPPDRYSPWQAGAQFMSVMRKRIAATLLHEAGAFPGRASQCLEIGYGSLGWLGDLVGWGVPETNLHGIELDEVRARRAKETLPAADLRIGDATSLPWPSGTFDLIVASTVFTSILDVGMRRALAREITRVLAPQGAFLWYDLMRNNPRNPHVRKVTRRELRSLFPDLQGDVRSATLVPPLARAAARASWTVATVLEAMPFLRTHLVAVLQHAKRPDLSHKSQGART